MSTNDNMGDVYKENFISYLINVRNILFFVMKMDIDLPMQFCKDLVVILAQVGSQQRPSWK